MSSIEDLANNLFPSELVSIPEDEWNAYFRLNKSLMIAMLNFWSDCIRVTDYRQRRLTSLPITYPNYSSVGSIQYVSPLNAISLLTFFQDDINNATTKAFIVASNVWAATTNLRTTLI